MFGVKFEHDINNNKEEEQSRELFLQSFIIIKVIKLQCEIKPILPAQPTQRMGMRTTATWPFLHTPPTPLFATSGHTTSKKNYNASPPSPMNTPSSQ